LLGQFLRRRCRSLRRTGLYSSAFAGIASRLTGKGATLIVDQDAADEYKEAFEKAFPKALQRVKELATQRQPAGATR
jgi:hypothetical protein